MKKGVEYTFTEKNIIKQGIFLGEYYVEKGMLDANTNEYSDIETSKYPVYFFLSKEFGLLAYNSMKQIHIEREIGLTDTKLSIQEINELIEHSRKTKSNSVFHTIFIKTIIKIKKEF